MTTHSPRRLAVVWLLLVAATLASFEFLSGGSDPRIAALAVLVVAFVKVRFVGREFMELRHAPRAMAWAFDLWLLLCCVGLGLFYIEGPGWAARGLLG